MRRRVQVGMNAALSLALAQLSVSFDPRFVKLTIVVSTVTQMECAPALAASAISSADFLLDCQLSARVWSFVRSLGGLTGRASGTPASRSADRPSQQP